MKQKSLFSRYSLFWVIIVCYLAPLISLTTYGAFARGQSANWPILSIGFLLTAVGSLAVFSMLTAWENSLHGRFKQHVANQETLNLFSKEKLQTIDLEEFNLTKDSLKEAQETQIRLLAEIEILTEERRQLGFDKEEALEEAKKIHQELEHTRQMARQELEKQQSHIRELQEVIADQKATNEKKQQQMLQLETKVSDLTCEIKTLLHFAEGDNQSLLSPTQEPPPDDRSFFSTKTETHFESPHPINSTKTAQEASKQLKQCLDIAQKIKGSQRFGSQIYSFLDSPADSFSLDLRRLCDRLRSETQSVILLYSPKDNQLLFASNQIKTLTGWSPEKFIQSFSELLVDDSEWKNGINSLARCSEAQIQLQLKTKSGTNCIAHATLGMIPTGIFRNHPIAVVYLP